MTVMTKDRPETGRSEGRASVWAFKDEEKEWGACLGSFQAKVTVDDLDGLLVKGQESLAVSFSPDEHLVLPQTKIFDLQAEGLTGAQTIKKHQGDNAQIAKGAQSAPERGDFGCCKWNDKTAGYFHPQLLEYPPGPSPPEG
jgi:hypothetical protein